MGTFLRRTTPTVCFFCQTTISPPPPQPLSFHCPYCSCWNHYDPNGDILSDDPAMHDESLNRRSFARRGPSSLSSILHPLISAPPASPRKDRLLTTFSNAPFCAACQSNQRLIVSLLSSYLPPSDDVHSFSPMLVSKLSYHLHLFHRIPIMNLALQASRPTKHPFTRVTLLSARSAHPSSKRKSGKRTAWRAQTRSDRG
jgi:hypothetical protein